MNFNWICTLCLFRQLPSAVTCDDSTNTTNNMDPTSDLLFASDIIASPVSGVRVIHHNVQGLMSKITEISDWLHGCDGDHVVFCCSETWLKPCNVVPSIPEFKLFCSPSFTRPAADSLLPGSAILVSGVLKPEHPDICDAVEKSCSVLNVACCFVTCKVHRIAIVSVYRSPSTSFADFFTDFDRVMSDLSSHVNNIIVAGDFNIDLICNSGMRTRYILESSLGF